MKLVCTTCGGSILADDIHLASGVAKCRGCHSVFAFEVPGASPRAARAPVPLPSRFVVRQQGRALQIVRRWYSPIFYGLAVFCVIWFGFLTFWYAMAASSGAPWIFLLFPLIHVGVGLGLAYFTVAGFVNRTELDADRSQIQVRHRPLPWPGNLTIPSNSVEQLFCVEKIHRGKNGAQHTYEVHLRHRGGRAEKLLSGLPEADQALFVEQTLERHLNIEDRPVPGELPR